MSYPRAGRVQKHYYLFSTTDTPLQHLSVLERIASMAHPKNQKGFHYDFIPFDHRYILSCSSAYRYLIPLIQLDESII